MGEYGSSSLVIAADYRVDDLEEMWTNLESRIPRLMDIAAHHVVAYESIWEPNRALLTIGVRHVGSVREVLRSPAIFELFDVSGVDDIPAVFAGEVVEKIDLHGPSPEGSVAGVIVGVVTRVDDVSALMVEVHAAADRFKRAGIRKIWIYRALDDDHEVMILQEIGDEISALRWIDRPDGAAEWMSTHGTAAYPGVFVGRLAHLMAVGERVHN